MAPAEREADWRRWAETVRKHLSPDSDIEWVPAALLECLDGLASLRAQLADREREVNALRGAFGGVKRERDEARFVLRDLLATSIGRNEVSGRFMLAAAPDLMTRARAAAQAGEG